MEEEEERNSSPGRAGGRGRVEGNFVWRSERGGEAGAAGRLRGGTGRDAVGMVAEGAMRGGVRTAASGSETPRSLSPGNIRCGRRRESGYP